MQQPDRGSDWLLTTTGAPINIMWVDSEAARLHSART